MQKSKMKSFGIKLRNMAISFACLAVTAASASCEPAEEPGPDAPAFAEFTFANQRGTSDIDAKKRTVKSVAECGTNIASLAPEFKLSPEGTTATVDGKAQESGKTAQNFTDAVVYSLTTPDGETAEWTVTITLPDDCPEAEDLLIFRKPKTLYIKYTAPSQIGDVQDAVWEGYFIGTEAESIEPLGYDNGKLITTMMYWSETKRWLYEYEDNYYWYDATDNDVSEDWQFGLHGDRGLSGIWKSEFAPGGHFFYPLNAFSSALFMQLPGTTNWVVSKNTYRIAPYRKNGEHATILGIVCDVFVVDGTTFWVDPETHNTLKIKDGDKVVEILEYDTDYKGGIPYKPN
jgi:hypothetical protein